MGWPEVTEEKRAEHSKYVERLRQGTSIDYLYRDDADHRGDSDQPKHYDQRNHYIVILPSCSRPRHRMVFIVCADDKLQAESALVQRLFTEWTEDYVYDPEWNSFKADCEHVYFVFVVHQNERDESPEETIKDFHDWLEADCPSLWVPVDKR